MNETRKGEGEHLQWHLPSLRNREVLRGSPGSTSLSDGQSLSTVYRPSHHMHCRESWDLNHVYLEQRS